MTVEAFPAYILAGGQSLRFGADKALRDVQGQSQLSRLRDQLVESGHEVHLVADRATRYSGFGMPCLVDIQPNCGPMAGLAAALQHCQESVDSGCRTHGWLLLIACDQMVWRQAWYRQLADAVEGHLQAVVFSARDDRGQVPQPLPGLYHNCLLAELLGCLSRGDYSLMRLLEQSPRVALLSTEDNPRDWSFNTPTEFDVILERLGTRES